VRYRIEYSPEAVDHLEFFTAREQAIILNAVDRQLANEPLKETRNRKPMRPNPIAPRELRIGTFRVYYDVVDEASEPMVLILAIGVKQRNRIRIGDEEIAL
jgi:mRNA-degrading endonuclease RelE of RelBE toxin-antitoxin system